MDKFYSIYQSIDEHDIEDDYSTLLDRTKEEAIKGANAWYRHEYDESTHDLVVKHESGDNVVLTPTKEDGYVEDNYLNFVIFAMKVEK